MGQQINIDLRFNADIQQAKAAMQELQNSLQQITMSTANREALFDSSELKRASAAATELQGKLAAAFNQKTGKLDLLKFSTDLKASGKDIGYFKRELSGVGQLGNKAFLQLAQSIAMSETPMLRLSARMKEFGTTLSNTVKWQLSSSMVHGFMGTVQKAYGYAQDLNRSLNDIRIVSGQSAAQMDKFAVQANKAAKALSTTTLDYTKGALIYYQQGLSDEEVKKRTDITMKMANVSQQSAEIVSDQLTAVWNNFAKGGENLEHFADVMVRLGADTASSSDEIADGLEKFAAIGDTVGLSFDNAAAALATVTATTRQSADVVGTAFKTLFARIQDLELGDTLEDGTTLGKYSEALKAVGIDIKEQNGNMKDMDIILNEMGNKWTTLSEDQQVALAQTVAGTRQYTQLIALMDNFDFYKKNLESAKGADGSLQEQANIYAESWEAAKARVQASLEDLYTKLISDDFFINLSNGLAKVVDGLGGFIDGLGGVKGLLQSIGSIFMSVFAQKMPEFLNNLKQNIMVITGLGKKQMLNTQAQTQAELEKMQTDPNVSNADKIKAEGTAKVTSMQQQYIQNMRYMSTTEQQEYQAKMKNVAALYKEAAALEKASAKMQNYQTSMTSQARVQARTEQAQRDAELKRQALIQERDYEMGQIQSPEGRDIARQMFQEQIEQVRAERDSYNNPEEIYKNFRQAEQNYYKTGKRSQLAGFAENSVISQTDAWEKQRAEIGNNAQEIQKLEANMRSFIKTKEKIAQDQGFDKITEALQENGEAIDLSKKKYDELLEILNKIKNAASEVASEASDEFLNSVKELEGYENIVGDKAIDDISTKGQQMGDTAVDQAIFDELRAQPVEKISAQAPNSQAFMALAGAAMQAQMAIASLTSTWQVFNNEQSTTAEKIGAVLSLFSTTTFAFIQGAEAINTLRNSKMVLTVATKIQEAATWGEVTAQSALNIAMGATLAIIALVVAAVYLLVKAYKNAQANSPEGQLNAAKKEAEQFGESLDKVKQQSEDLKSSFDQYDSVKSKLSECTQGSKEWSEALKENNDNVQELIEKYPKLTSMVNEKGEKAVGVNAQTGEMQIADWARIQLQNEQANREAVMSFTKRQADQNIKQKEIDVLQSKVDKAEFDLKNKPMKDVAGNASHGRSSYFTTNRWLPMSQSEIEARRAKIEEGQLVNKIKAVPGTDTNVVGQEILKIEEIVPALINQYGQEAAQHILDLVPNLSEDQINAIRESIQAELDLKTAIQENSAITKAQNEAQAAEMLQESEAYQKSKYKDLIGNIVGEKITNASNDVSRESILNDSKWVNWTDDATNWTNWADRLVNPKQFAAANNGGVVNFTKEALETYLNTIPETQELGLDLNNLRTGAMGQAYIDYFKDGKNQKFELNADEIIKVLQSQVSLEGITGFGDEFSKQINQFTDRTQAELFAAMAKGGDLSVLSSDTLAKSGDELKKIVDNMALSEDYLKSINKDFANNLIPIEKASEQYKEQIKHLIDQKEALQDINNNWTKNIALIKQGKDDQGNYTKQAQDTAKQMSKAFGKAFDIDDLELDAGFFERNESLINDFINNVEGAGQKLRKAMAFEQIKLEIPAEVKTDQAWQDFQNWINNTDFDKIEVGTALDNQGLIDGLNEMLKQGKIGADQLNSIFRTIGWEPVVKYKEIPISDYGYSEANSSQTVQVWVPDGGSGDTPESRGEGPGGHIETMTLKSAQQYKAVDGAKIRVPYLESAVKTGKDSGFNFGSNFTGTGTSPSGGSNPGGSGGKGGGGGGGGGGGSTPKVKTKKFNAPRQATEQKKARDEIDRYHTITKQIEALTKAMDLLNEQKDKVWGRKRLELMDQEIKKMQEQKGLLIQEGKEIEKNLALSKSELLTKFPNAKFDSKGNIANYEELKEQAIGAYNSAMSTYDETMKGIDDRKKAIEEEKEGYTDENDPAGEDGYTKRDRLQEEIDNTLAEKEYEAGKAKEAAEKAYEEANKAIEYYEETITKQAENLEKMIKLQTEMLDKQVELVDYAYEISKEVKELKKTIIDNAKFKWENDFTKFAELGNLLDQSADISIEDYKKWEETRKKQEEQYIGNRDQYLKWLSENKDNLQNIISGMQDNITGIQEFYENTLDKLDEKWDEYFDKLDYYTNVIDKYKSLSALTGREANQQFIKAFAQAGYQTAAQASDARKSEYLKAKDSYEKMLNKSEDEVIKNGEDVEKFRKDLEATRKRFVESQDSWLDSLQDLGERANTLLQSELAIVKETMENEIFGMSLEDYQKELDMLNAKQEDYLTTTNKMYETNKLIRTVQNDMNKTENKVAKERLNNFQKEIKALQENQKVSKTTLSIKQAEYDLLKAQLALEEARNAKDQVRLTRDAEGNFGYVYTANEDKVANAEQAVDDARNKIYNLSLDALKQGQAKWMSTYSEWQSEKERLDEEFRTGKKTRAEYNAAQEKAQSDYYDRLKDIEEEYGLAHDKMIEYAYDNQADYLLKGALDIDQFEESSSKALKNSGIAWDEWGKNVKRLTDATGDSFKDTSEKLYGLTEASKKFAEESNKEPDGLVPTLRKQEEAARGTESQLRQTIKTIKEYYDLATGSYKSNIYDPLASSAGEVQDYSQLAIDHLQNLSGWKDMSIVDVIKNSEIRQILDDRRKQKPDSDNIDYQALIDEEARLNGTDTARYKILAAEQYLKIVNKDWSKIMVEYKEATGQEPPDWMYNRQQQKILSKDWLHDIIYPYIRDNLGSNYTADELIENLRYMWYMTELQMMSKGFTETEAANEVNRLKGLIKKGIITPRDYGVAYDTGGYTGKWGPEGRLAVLHEKELVLNASDTENFLKSIQVLREISAVLDKNALVAATANLASLKTSFERQPLEQNVQIHAEFPNVQDHNEIEIAIRNLTNAASQYVN